jgi:16S rRNA (cytosine967-C5)-methyltransferase
MKPRAGGTARSAPRRARIASTPALDARRIALEILLTVDERGAFADLLLGRRIGALNPADRRLATRLVLGTIAWRARLDHELERLSTRALESLDPAVLAILRMGLFQLRFLERIPAYAAVNTAVALAHANREARPAAGLVNAVMRRASRETIALPPRDADESGWLALRYSHPRWLAERFIEWFGIQRAEALMAANNEAAPNAIRLNLARASRAEIVARLAADGMEIAANGRAPETMILSGAPRFDCVSYRDGLFQPQSEASQLVARILAPRTGASVIDCAAAPGGKSTHLAELVGAAGRVIALDVNFSGLRNARALTRRLRHRNIDFVRADLTEAPPLRARAFEYVMLDAPCTGLGTLREHPEIRWRLEGRDFARMAAIQSTMLANAATLVRDGGALVYSVCSIAPEEGERVVRAFLEANRDFKIDSRPPNRHEIADLLATDGSMRTRPDLGGLDGFYAARLTCARKS